MFYNMILFGERFLDIRKSRGYSIKKLSSASTISVNTIRTIERGTSIPSLLTLSILSTELKYDLRDELIKLCYSKDSIIENILYDLDMVSETRKYTDLIEIKERINYILESTKIRNELRFIQLEQINLWVSGLIQGMIYNKHDEAIRNYVSALSVTIINFKLEAFKTTKYTYQELNILNSIAASYLIDDYLEYGISILEFIHKYLQNTGRESNFGAGYW